MTIPTYAVQLINVTGSNCADKFVIISSHARATSKSNGKKHVQQLVLSVIFEGERNNKPSVFAITHEMEEKETHSAFV